ncbi:MAG: hypothetical protein FD167_3458 [bacterium]|nr:MAG: hypothetical protein FD167_3458 [bacterium]
MANEYLFVPTFNQGESQLGLITKIYAIESGFRGSVFSYNPSHSFSMQGEKFQKTLLQRLFLNGKYGYTIDVTDNSLTSGTDKITINGVDYVFDDDDSTATHIMIGGSTSLTETAISVELDAVSGISADTTSVEGKVLVTSDDGTALTVTTNVPSKITITQYDIPATLPLIFTGDTLTENTLNVLQIPITVNSLPDMVYIVAKTPASASIASLVTQIFDVASHALAGTDPTTKGFVFSKNLASRIQIKTALRLAFGSTAATAFVISTTTVIGDTLTLKLVGTDTTYAGYQGNFFY